jgi:ankyrin repeat protein
MTNQYRLFELAFSNDAEGLRRELDAGANVAQIHDQAGHTALQVATVSSSLEAVKTLLDLGANPNQRFSKRSLVSGSVHADQVALMYASHAGIIALLRSAGADLDSIDSRGRTALSIAVERCDPIAVSTLLSLGARTCVVGSVHEKPGDLKSICAAQLAFWTATNLKSQTERAQNAIADGRKVLALL